jgi:ABC-type phosphate transport system substrate-binding protein
MKLDPGFFERASALQDATHLAALKSAILQAMPGDPDAPAAAPAALATYIDTIWRDAGVFGFNSPVSSQKYVLIHLTHAKWRANPTHLAYVARMIGTPNQNWRIESGVLAAYANVVAARYLSMPLITFMEKQEKTVR